MLTIGQNKTQYMASVQFGKTWWGQQWLNALTNIDYSNRLPRGASYARNGSVLSIAVEDNIIRAKVQGSQRKPYEVMLVIPPFFEKDVTKLIDAIALKPVIVSKLLSRELDPELLNIAENCGLKIFPKQWTDFKMQCSCPDWAVPCKHLAAVVYKLSAEIDNNPFLVFELHKVDLIKELERVNIHISKKSIEVGRYTELLEPKGEAAPDVELTGGAPNFASLYPMLDALVQLLADEPVFYPHAGNFKDKYTASLRKASKDAMRIVQGKQPLVLEQSTQLVYSHHNKAYIEIDANAVGQLVLDGSGRYTMETCMAALWQIPPAYESDFQPEIASLRTILLLSINLVANAAVVPQITQLENGSYMVRWLPAMLSKDVRKLVDAVQNSLSSGLLYLAESVNAKKGKASRSESIPMGNEAVAISSLFIGALIRQFWQDKSPDAHTELFFGGKPNLFSSPGEDGVAGGIQSWLQRFFMTNEKFKPAIVVEELADERFKIGIEIQETANLLDKPVSMEMVFTDKTFEKTRYEILQSLGQLGSFIPGLDDYINEQGKKALVLDMAAFAPFLMDAIPAIQLLDISLLLPKSLQNILRPKASVRVKAKGESSGMLRLDKLLDFDWQVAIGDSLVGEAEFRQLMMKADGLLKYKSNYIYVSPIELEKLYKHFEASKSLTAHELLRVALADNYHGARISLTQEVQALIAELTSQTELPLPQDLQANLRPYQIRGYSWMYRNAQIGFGSVLADDMGLGKTLQVIAILLKYKQEGALKKEKVLVVAPTGLLANWQAEIQKFAPSLLTGVYHGPKRVLNMHAECDVLITTYGIVRSDADILKKKKWQVLVIDEAQNIKNHTTEQSKAVKSIKANTFIAMSGTPVENRLSELWSIMDFSNRGFLGNLKEFKETYSDPIQNMNDAVAAGQLKKVTAPFLMRRMKTDKSIISDLPEKIEINAYCQLVAQQASLYEKTLEEAMNVIEGIGTSKKDLFVRQGLVLQMILALKQICNHPTQFLKNNVQDASLSGKLQMLYDKLESIVESNEKVLIFTQFTEMGKLLEHFIAERFGEAPLFYHGGCTVAQRNDMVQAFQTNRADKIFILSLKAAGTGLNLTAANHVIHYDLWWNPAVEAQATDRAYRIGQKSNVMVHRFITKNTFEEKINDLIQSKKDLAEMSVATGENWIGNMSNKEIKEIFTLS
jgi:uncharacterized Zn finger protein/ERCC4-related helicase